MKAEIKVVNLSADVVTASGEFYCPCYNPTVMGSENCPEDE